MNKNAIIVWTLTALLLGACVDRRYVPDPNPLPLADARVVDPMGASVFTPVMFPFAGSPVAVTLDGRASTDANGSIIEYRWRVTNTAGESVEAKGAAPMATVMLGEGVWYATLWVTDNQKAVGTSDTTAAITIGMPMAAMGGAGGTSGGAGMGAAGMGSALSAEECSAMVIPALSDTCKTCLCGMENCRSAVISSACGPGCWALIRCLGINCPTFAMDMNVTCLATNCGAEYSMYMSEPQGATAAGPCAVMCRTECSSM